MSHLICHSGKRVVVILRSNSKPVVRHRSDGSICKSQTVFFGKIHYKLTDLPNRWYNNAR